MVDLATTATVEEEDDMCPSDNATTRRETAKSCRDQLASHIECQTGLVIDSARVRLIPKKTDAYLWAYTPADSHLFSKNMGQLNVASYRELSRKVGKTFFAIARASLQNSLLSQSYPKPTSEETGIPFGSYLSEPLPDIDFDLDSHGNIDAFLVLKEKLILETTCREQLQLEIENLQSAYEILGQRFKKQSEKVEEQGDMLFRCLRTLGEIMRLAEGTRAEYVESMDIGVFPA